MAPNALLIGTVATCRRLERQLDLVPDRPATLGWVLLERDGVADREPVLGTLAALDALAARHRPDLALVSLPAAMAPLVTSVRTRLRRLGVPDRFMPTLEDQIAGVGPRSLLEVDPAELLRRPPRAIDEAAVRRVIEGRRVLITGAGGSIGGELARIVARFAPRHLVLVDRAENALFEIDRQVARRHPDLPRRALLHDVVEAGETRDRLGELRPQVVFHAAAHKHVPMMEDHPAAAVDNNLFGTRSVVDAAAACRAERCVMISTDKAVNPSSIMGATKRLAELYVQYVNRTSATAFSLVRFGNVLGSTGSVLDTWSRQIAEGGPITVTHPDMTRYFMTIPEAASLVIQSAALAGEGPGAGEVYLLDMGAPVRILDLAARFVELHGLVPLVPGAPGTADGAAGVRIAFTSPRPGEKMHEELARAGDALRPTDHPDINIWEMEAPRDRYIRDMLRALRPGSRPRDPVALARLIRELLPEMVEPVAT